MTEIPEHLLKRSKQRRAAIGGGGDEGGDAGAAPESAAPAEAAAPATPAPAAAAPAPEPVAPEPVPTSPQVLAYQQRRRIPYWAMPVLVAIPLWAYMFQATLEPPPAGIEGAMAVGEELYAACAACHGGSGQGVGSFPALNAVGEDFPDGRDHMMWVKLGSSGWPADTYGATDKPVQGGMPPHPQLTDEELAAVVHYERVAFGGVPEDDENEEIIVQIAEGETTFAEAGLGPESEEVGVSEAELGG